MFMFFVVLLVAFSSQTTMAQRRESCVAYDKSRTMEGFKSVILTWKDPFVKNQLWPEYVRLINEGLKTSKIERVRKMVVPVTLVGVAFIVEHSFQHEKSHFKQEDYDNGVRIDNTMVYPTVPVMGRESDWVVFEYEDVSIMYAKVACCNPEKLKIPVAYYTPPTQVKITPIPTLPVSKPDTIKKSVVVEETIFSHRRSDEYVDDNYYAPEYWVTPIFYIGNCRQYGRPFQVANIRSYQNNSHYACATRVERRSNTNGGRRTYQFQPRPQQPQQQPHAKGPNGGRSSQPNTTGPKGRGDGSTGNNAGGSGGRGDNATTTNPPTNNAGGRSSYSSRQTTIRSQFQGSRPQYGSSAGNYSAKRPTYSGNSGGGGYSSASQHQQSYSGSNAGHAGNSRGRSR